MYFLVRSMNIATTVIVISYDLLVYLINIHWLSVDFDWSGAGHADGAILACRMIILPSDVISAYKKGICTCSHMRLFTLHVEGAILMILSCHMIRSCDMTE